jgi:hypothetical protein
LPGQDRQGLFKKKRGDSAALCAALSSRLVRAHPFLAATSSCVCVRLLILNCGPLILLFPTTDAVSNRENRDKRTRDTRKSEREKLFAAHRAPGSPDPDSPAKSWSAKRAMARSALATTQQSAAEQVRARKFRLSCHLFSSHGGVFGAAPRDAIVSEIANPDRTLMLSLICILLSSCF